MSADALGQMRNTKSPSADVAEGPFVLIRKNLLLVVDGGALDVFAGRISSAQRDRAGLAISRDGGFAGDRNLAAFLDGQVRSVGIDLLDGPRV